MAYCTAALGASGIKGEGFGYSLQIRLRIGALLDIRRSETTFYVHLHLPCSELIRYLVHIWRSGLLANKLFLNEFVMQVDEAEMGDGLPLGETRRALERWRKGASLNTFWQLNDSAMKQTSNCLFFQYGDSKVTHWGRNILAVSFIILHFTGKQDNIRAINQIEFPGIRVSPRLTVCVYVCVCVFVCVCVVLCIWSLCCIYLAGFLFLPVNTSWAVKRCYAIELARTLIHYTGGALIRQD